MDARSGKVIDASLRFARSNPEVVLFANQKAARLAVPVDDLLRDAIERVAATRARQRQEPFSLRDGRPILRAV